MEVENWRPAPMRVVRCESELDRLQSDRHLERLGESGLDPITKLARPPIVEALVDFRVKPRADLEVNQLMSLQEQFGKELFPIAQQQVMNRIHLEAPAGPFRSTSELTGVILRSVDQTQVVQVQRDGFAFSRLVPYTSWEDLVTNARLRWN